MHRVPFFRPSIGTAEIDEVVATLQSGWLTTGERTKRFEAAFADYVGARFAIALTSCTAALHLALEAVGIEPGDGVLVPTMTFAATAEVVSYLGGIPILVDAKPGDLTLDVADARTRALEAARRGIKIKAIVPVHYAGQACEMRRVMELAKELDLSVIEDAAHCCPAFYRDSSAGAWMPVGSEARAACYSFYANKTITTGEGGMVTTNDEELAHRMRLMSLHGISHDAWKRFTDQGSWYYEIVAPGFKYNMTDIAGGLGLQQLARANELRLGRERIAQLYTDMLSRVPGLQLLDAHADRIHSWHLFVVRLLEANRDDVITALKERGIGTSVHWMPLHMHPYYRSKYGYKEADFPVAAAAFRQIVSLPIYPDLPHEDARWVASELTRLVEGGR